MDVYMTPNDFNELDRRIEQRGKGLFRAKAGQVPFQVSRIFKERGATGDDARQATRVVMNQDIWNSSELKALRDVSSNRFCLHHPSDVKEVIRT